MGEGGGDVDICSLFLFKITSDRDKKTFSSIFFLSAFYADSYEQKNMKKKKNSLYNFEQEIPKIY